MLIGVVIGCFSGLYGGRVDMVIMRLVDIMIAIPFLIWVSLLVMLVLEPGMLSIIAAFALTQWTEIARLVRGEVAKARAHRVRDCRAVAGRRAPWRLIGRHFFPNILPVVIVAVTFQVTNAIFGEAFLSYIGLGIQAPLTSWGKLVAAGIKRDARQPLHAGLPLARHLPHHAGAAIHRRRPARRHRPETSAGNEQVRNEASETGFRERPPPQSRTRHPPAKVSRGSARADTKRRCRR